jgi:hypothetical protein
MSKAASLISHLDEIFGFDKKEKPTPVAKEKKSVPRSYDSPEAKAWRARKPDAGSFARQELQRNMRWTG